MVTLIRFSIYGLVLCLIVVGVSSAVGRMLPGQEALVQVQYLGPGPGETFRFVLMDRMNGLKVSVAGTSCCRQLLPSDLAGSSENSLVASVDDQGMTIVDMAHGVRWYF